ncbi:FIST N-terminal domain-containing protein [Magnetococcus sp. PR-3]|uniref:FIST N-terminal domain-containing protein n=1 Tax=Magnetococcus sp. PR-3 TaxID=3120355 RepID=UPI002FCE3183
MDKPTGITGKLSLMERPSQSIPHAHTTCADEQQAVAQLYGQLGGTDAAVVVVFCSASYDVVRFSQQLQSCFVATRIIGCTTAGEISPDGISRGGVSAFALPKQAFQVSTLVIESLSQRDVASCTAQVESFYATYGQERPDTQRFALLLIDGLSRAEEVLLTAIGSVMSALPIVGGSAGDELSFERTYLFQDGKVYEDVAFVLLIHSSYHIKAFKTEHLQPLEHKMVVTRADPAERLVYEIDGGPAAHEYAQAMGLPPEAPLSPSLFAAHPIMVRVGGEHYVRSVATANADHSLTFFCAIDQGNVFTLGKGGDLAGSYERILTQMSDALGAPSLVIGFDCIFRRLEVDETGIIHQVEQLASRYRVVGFNTYGEQYQSMHMNCTFTGVYISQEKVQGKHAPLASMNWADAQPPLAGSVESLSREVRKLRRVNQVLMDQVERNSDFQQNAYAMFQTAIKLDHQVKERTGELESTLNALQETNQMLEWARQEAERNRQYLQEVIHSTSEGIVVYNQEGKLTLHNNTFTQIFPRLAYILKEGALFSDIIRAAASSGEILEARQDPDAWVKMRCARRAHIGEPFLIHLSDGRCVQVRERHTDQGDVVGIYTDITGIKQAEKKRRETELAQQNLLLQATLAGLSQGVAVFSQDNHLLQWNDPFTQLLDLPLHVPQVGMSVEALQAHNAIFYEAFPHAEGPQPQGTSSSKQPFMVSDGWIDTRHHTLAFTYGLEKNIEVRRNTMPGGGCVFTFSDVTPYRDATRALSNARDTLSQRVAERTHELIEVNQQLRLEITERQEMERSLESARDEAEEANARKTKFMAVASHDLLQPLNAARLMISSLLEREMRQENKQMVQRINMAMEGVESLLTDLMDISKFDAKVVEVNPSPFATTRLLNALENEFSPVAAQAGLVLTVQHQSYQVVSDYPLLSRVLRNFISNAIRYTPHGEVQVRCRLSDEAGFCRFEVQDSGIGIDQEKWAEVFEDFRQLPNFADEDLKRHKGAGLGLAIVKRIAQILDHPIGLDSTLGEGSLFWIDVPVISVQTHEPAQAPLVTTSQSENFTNLPVLVIDNDPDILYGMRTLLEPWGCLVYTALDATQAEQQLQQVVAQGASLAQVVVLADYQLDDGALGPEVVQNLRAQSGAQLPCLVITANYSQALSQQLQAEGFQVLCKPLKPAKLRALLAYTLTALG